MSLFFKYHKGLDISFWINTHQIVDCLNFNSHTCNQNYFDICLFSFIKVFCRGFVVLDMFRLIKFLARNYGWKIVEEVKQVNFHQMHVITVVNQRTEGILKYTFVVGKSTTIATIQFNTKALAYSCHLISYFHLIKNIVESCDILQ